LAAKDGIDLTIIITANWWKRRLRILFWFLIGPGFLMLERANRLQCGAWGEFVNQHFHMIGSLLLSQQLAFSWLLFTRYTGFCTSQAGIRECTGSIL